jgi:hypothetical protein
MSPRKVADRTPLGRRKRAAYQAKIAPARQDLAHINAVIRLVEGRRPLERKHYFTESISTYFRRAPEVGSQNARSSP